MILPKRRAAAAIGVQVRQFAQLSDHERELLELAGLQTAAPVQAWKVTGTNAQLAYATHGVFRYFGKFPPPIARHLIGEFTAPGQWVLDPMAGSGTTAVEAQAMGRPVVVRDISPLSQLLCRVKTTPIALQASADALARVLARMADGRDNAEHAPVGLRDVGQWFLPATAASLARIRAAIEQEAPGAERELLLTAFASTVRRVSKATTQQGRLFLDAVTAQPDAWPTFRTRLEKYAKAVAALPEGTTPVVVEQGDVKAASPTGKQFQLAICHPPYFNNYKYSSINALELAWLGVAPQSIRGPEIREAFKVGKPEKVAAYVQDLAQAVAAVAGQLLTGGVLALMMGDTTIRGGYIDVTRQLLTAITETGTPLRLDRVVLRVPQYTEASWVASQRRTGATIGVTLYDFILLFSRLP